MLWAAALVTFSFCRSDKVTVEDESKYDAKAHLYWADVAVDNVESPSLISLIIKYFKTDQGRVRGYVVLSKTGDGLCPISTLLKYLTRREK